MTKKTRIAAVAAVVYFVTAGIVFAQDAALNQRKPAVTDQDLIIQIKDVSENALFYPVNIDGMKMEVLAVKAPDGTIRTAFNACQVCYSSGRGYFVQKDTVLVCQNCGRRYRMSQVERQTGGCNPEPILPANKSVTNSTITISREYLKLAKTAFESRKKG
ncbi:DUF2318 domain-containing protein [Treponema sp. R80B11-R83G3]